MTLKGEGAILDDMSETEWRLAESITRLAPRCRGDEKAIEEIYKISRIKIAWYGAAVPILLVAVGLLFCLSQIGQRPPNISLGGGVYGFYLAVAFSRYFAGRTAGLTAMSVSLFILIGSISSFDLLVLLYLLAHGSVFAAMALLPFNRDEPGQRVGLLSKSRKRRSKEFTRDSIWSSWVTGLPPLWLGPSGRWRGLWAR